MFLLVDDDLDILDFYCEYLQSRGALVLCARSAASALSMYKKYADEIRGVISDGEMPGENGIWLAERIREISGTHESPRLILFSGNESMLREPKAMRLFNQCIAKPEKPEVLWQLLSERDIG